MIDKEKFELLPYHNNFLSSKKQNSLDRDTINNITYTIKTIVNYCDSVLMQECNDFQDFTGRDVDTF